MNTENRIRNPRKLSLKAVLGIIFLAIIISVAATIIVAKTWLFPAPVKQTTLNPQEEAVLEAKLNTLKEESPAALQSGPYREHPEDRVIYFTQRELNSMIARNSDLAGRVSFYLSDNQISAAMLVDMPEDFPVLGGKTVRLSTGLHVDYQQGRPVITVQGISIMGVPLPAAWLGGIKGRDLVSFYSSEGGFWQVFSSGVKDLRVEDGKLRVELAY